jgi:flagellar basal-body rod modification protein FlgD
MFMTPIDTSALDAGRTTTAAQSNNASDAAQSQDRFLKLLVAQLNNQDPMNPLDNAQMTSQIAQINTVTGIQQLNDTVKGMMNQFAAQQLMQAGSMVGRQVLVEGNTLAIDSTTDKAGGVFDLAGSAASVTVQVLDPNGKQVGTVEMGPLKAGRYNFDWDASDYEGATPLRFKVVAANGETAVASTALMRDKVSAVSMDNGTLYLQLEGGGTANYNGIKAIL